MHIKCICSIKSIDANVGNKANDIQEKEKKRLKEMKNHERSNTQFYRAYKR